MEERILNKILSAKDSFEIKVRFNDTYHGDVHFKNYLDYFNDGFINFMKDIENPVQTAGLSGIIFPVKNLIIKYENPATFGDHVIVETKIKEIDENSITFLHKIYRESDKAILANVECVRSVMELESKKLLDVKKFFIDFV